MPRRRRNPRSNTTAIQPTNDVTRLYNNDSRTLVEKYGRMAAPFFRIEINDKDNKTLFSSESAINESGYDLEGLMIYEVEYDETDCKTSMIRLNMANPKMDLQDGLIFTEGNTIDLWMGYDGLDPDYMGRGFIVEISPTFEAGDIPRFSVVCYDISHFLMEEGRGDIVPEGTTWYERKRRTTNVGGGGTTNGTSSGSNSDTNQNPRPNPAEEDRRSNRSGSVSGSGTTQNTATVNSSTGNDSRRNPNANANSTATQENSRAEWTRWRQPRRGRNNGKVWRGKSDSEIVDAILESYGIVPYTKATRESKSTTRTVTIESGGRPESLGLTNIRDTQQQAENVESEVAQFARRRTNIDIKSVHISNRSTNEARNIDLLSTEIYAVPRLQPGETATITTREDRKVTQKNGTSDWDFIKELARKHSYIFFVFFHYDSGKWIGYWGSDTQVPQQQTYSFKYAQGDATSLARVKPTISLREQKTEIDLQYVDPRSGKENLLRVSTDNLSPVYSQIRGNASSRSVNTLGNGPEVILSVFGRRTSVMADRNFESAEDARDWLVSFWIRNARDFCRVEGQTIIGLPEMRARQHHIIDGIGRMSGNYFITKTVHRMGTGHVYETKFNGFRTIDTLFTTADVENEIVDLGELPPPGEEENTLFSR